MELDREISIRTVLKVERDVAFFCRVVSTRIKLHSPFVPKAYELCTHKFVLSWWEACKVMEMNKMALPSFPFVWWVPNMNNWHFEELPLVTRMNNENDWLEECWNYPSGYYAGTQSYCCLLKISDNFTWKSEWHDESQLTVWHTELTRSIIFRLRWNHTHHQWLEHGQVLASTPKVAHPSQPPQSLAAHMILGDFLGSQFPPQEQDRQLTNMAMHRDLILCCCLHCSGRLLLGKNCRWQCHRWHFVCVVPVAE